MCSRRTESRLPLGTRYAVAVPTLTRSSGSSRTGVNPKAYERGDYVTEARSVLPGQRASHLRGRVTVTADVSSPVTHASLSQGRDSKAAAASEVPFAPHAEETRSFGGVGSPLHLRDWGRRLSLPGFCGPRALGTCRREPGTPGPGRVGELAGGTRGPLGGCVPGHRDAHLWYNIRIVASYAHAFFGYRRQRKSGLKSTAMASLRVSVSGRVSGFYLHCVFVVFCFQAGSSREASSP